MVKSLGTLSSTSAAPQQPPNHLIQKRALYKILYTALAVVNVGELRAAEDDVTLVAHDVGPCVSCCTHWQHVKLWAHASQIHAVIHWVRPAPCAILLRVQQREPDRVREREAEMEKERAGRIRGGQRKRDEVRGREIEERERTTHTGHGHEGMRTRRKQATSIHTHNVADTGAEKTYSEPNTGARIQKVQETETYTQTDRATTIKTLSGSAIL